MNSRGSMETGELILVVIMVMILLVGGLAAYSYFATESLQEMSREFESLNAIVLAQKASSMPELACGFAEEVSTECIDKYRLGIVNGSRNSLGPQDNAYNYYTSVFGSSTVKVDQLYPEKKTWIIWNSTLPNSSSVPIRMPVMLYDPVEQENSFGVMTVVRYS